MKYRVYFSVTKKYYVDLEAQTTKAAEALADHEGEKLLCDEANSVEGNTLEVLVILATPLDKQNPEDV